MQSSHRAVPEADNDTSTSRPVRCASRLEYHRTQHELDPNMNCWLTWCVGICAALCDTCIVIFCIYFIKCGLETMRVLECYTEAEEGLQLELVVECQIRHIFNSI